VVEFSIFLGSFSLGIFLGAMWASSGVKKSCDHEWGKWCGNFMIQERICSKCGLMGRQAIEYHG